MRYETDINGYITCVFWGCYTENSTEYTGEVPTGYGSLVDWADNACLNAYYIDENGNLSLDMEKEVEILERVAQEAADNAPVVRKDLFETEMAFGSQNLKSGGKGRILTFHDVLNLPPVIKLTHIEPADRITIFAHGRNMLRLNHKNVTEAGITIEWLADAESFVFTGVAEEAFEYTLSGSANSATPVFALMAGRTYSLYVGDIECEFRCFNGETTEIVYSGPGGQIVLPENKKVTHVVLKIPAGYSRELGLRPTLCDGYSALDPYETPDYRTLTIDVSKYIDKSEVLYPGESTFPGTSSIVKGIDYILIAGGSINISVNGRAYCIGQGEMRLLNGFNSIYTDQFAVMEMEYTTTTANIEDLSFMQGKATSTRKFEILPDGSIRANNGYFSGELNSEAGKIGGFTLNETSLTANLDWDLGFSIDTEEEFNYHLDRIQKILVEIVTPTDEELEMYDINGDGRISSVDTLMLRRLYNGTYDTKGTFTIDSLDGKRTLKFNDSLGGGKTSIGVNGIYSEGINANYMSALRVEASHVEADSISINNASIGDFVVYQGIDNGWTWRKWNSGVAECWAHIYGTGNSAAGNNMVINLPFEFSDTEYVVNATRSHNGSTVSIFGDYDGAGNRDHRNGAFFFRYYLTSNYYPSFNFHIIGRWK